MICVSSIYKKKTSRKLLKSKNRQKYLNSKVVSLQFSSIKRDGRLTSNDLKLITKCFKFETLNSKLKYQLISKHNEEISRVSICLKEKPLQYTKSYHQTAKSNREDFPFLQSFLCYFIE